jgi:hypothetical protein
MIRLPRLIALTALLTFAGVVPAVAADFTLQQTEKGVTVLLDG